MAQKKKKTLSSRPIAPQPPRALSLEDYGAAIAAIMLICGLIGVSFGLLLFSETDQAAFSRAFSFGTPFDLGSVLASAAFWKTTIGMLLGAVGGYLLASGIPKGYLAKINTIGKIVLIVVPVIILYLPTISAGFIWDDDQEITANLSLRVMPGHSGWDGLWEIWSGMKSADYFPLKTTMLWIEYQFMGPDAGWYHTVNFILHAIDSVLVWMVLRRLAVPGAWLAGFVFAIHPVHVESVAWIAERKNTLSLFFYLLALLAWFNYEDKQRMRDYLFALLLFVAGLLCKTHLVVLPVVLLLVSWWRNGFSGVFNDPIEDDDERTLVKTTNAVIGGIGVLAGIGAFYYLGHLTHLYHLDPNDAYIKSTYMFKTGAIAMEFWFLAAICVLSGIVGLVEGIIGLGLNRLIVRTMAFFQIAVLLGALTVWFQYGRAIGDERIPHGGMPSRLANAGKASWWYLTKSIFPVNPWYEMRETRPIEAEADAMAIVYDGKKQVDVAPALPVGKFKLWPLITIYPRWRITPPVWYDFIPAVLMAAFLVLLWLKRDRWGRSPFFVLAYFLVTLIPVIGILKMSYMRLTLVADHFQYLSDLSIIAFLCAVGTLFYRKISPSLKPVVMGAAVLLIGAFTLYSWDRVKIYEGEYTLWGDTLLKNPDAWQAHNHMGAVLFMQSSECRRRGMANEANKLLLEATYHFSESCRLKPENPESHNNLGLGYVSQGRMEEGIAEYRRAIQIRNWEPSMHTNLGNALGQVKRYDEAIAEYKEAIRLNPQDPASHCNLGYVLLQQGRLNEAITELQKALTIDPNMQQARQNLDAALQMRNGGGTSHY
ncbi:MAG: tetratricopeptide repeat protein [Verrucomicrobiota bacterium]